MVPERFVRKQTLTNGERYITEELKELEGVILGAQEKLVDLEYKLFLEIRKKIENEIWELRPLRNRILFASVCYNKFILLNIFMKQTQKTPKGEIEKAKRLLKDYKDRSGKDE